MVFTKAIFYCAVVLATVYLTSVSCEGGNGQPGIFSIFPAVVPCNYTEQSGASCVSCNQSLLCFANNVGLQWNCGGFLPNCNEGHCSTIRSENCTSS